MSGGTLPVLDLVEATNYVGIVVCLGQIFESCRK